MRLTKSLPLPRDRLQTEEVAEDDRVGPGMGDDDDSLVGIVDSPQVSVIGVHRVDPVRVHGVRQPRDDTIVEGAEALPTRQTVPHLVDRSLVCLGKDAVDLLNGRPLPLRWVLDFLQPWEHLDVLAQLFGDRLGRFDCSPQRGDPNLVDVIEAG